MKEFWQLLKRLDLRELFFEPTKNSFLQFFRYVFVGGIATVIDLGVLFLLTDIVHVHYLVSTIIAFAAGLLTNFILSKILVFKANKAKVNPTIEFMGFALIGIVGLGITEVIMFLLTDCLKLYYLVSKIIATVIVLMWNYIARKKIIYH